jgi:hypothetical protein
MNVTNTKAINFIDSGSSSDLLCPRCGSEYLCHTGAVFFNRGEDGESVVRIEVDGPKVGTSVVPSANSGNPSSRRHGMTIQFSCEQCSGPGDLLDLNIGQHKGVTEMTWSFSPRRPQ